MRFALRLSFVTAALTLTAVIAIADTAPCDAKSLTGNYGYKLTGFVYDNQGYTYYLGAVGRIVSDGAGNLTGTDTYSFDGTVAKRQISGSYTVNADCTGSITLTSPGSLTTSADFVITNNGVDVDLVQTDSGFIATATMKQQNPVTPAVPTTPPTPLTPADPPTSGSLQRR